MTATLRLSIRGLCKDYAVRVLDRVDLDLAPGEVHALLGANGAGKSTLCRILAGLLDPSSGEMTLDGAPYRPAGKRQAEERGVQIVQQELNLIPTLTVAENLFLNRLPHRLGWIGWIDRERLSSDSRSVLDRVGLGALDPSTPVATLGVGARQLVEIAAALAGSTESQCRVLILDEPTAALTASETATLFHRVRYLRDSGVSVLYVSHRLDEIRDLCDRVTVLRDGRWVATRGIGELSTGDMVSLMSGDALDATAAPQDLRPASARAKQDAPTAPALRVEHLTRGSQVRDVSFEVKRGERLGIAGLVGSGRSELLRAIFGADRADSGSIRVGDQDPTGPFAHPSQAVGRGLALVTEDRKDDGLLLSFSVRANTTLARLPHHRGWLDRRREIERGEHRCRELDIQCRGIEQPAGELSGGNQQKVVIAKWLDTDADVYLLDEPTRGIDVATRQRLAQLFEELARRGKALVIVSSDLDELMQLCDSIVVLSAGRLVSRFERGTWSRSRILQAAFAQSVAGPGAGSVPEGDVHPS